MWDPKKMVIAGVLLALAGGSWWLSNRADRRTPGTPPGVSHDPDYIVEDFTATVMNDEGLRHYVLRADKLVHYPDTGASELDRPHFIQYREEQEILSARADKARLTDKATKILLTGDVHVLRNPDARFGGGEIDTETLTLILDK